MRKILGKRFAKMSVVALAAACGILTGCEKSSDEHVDLYEYMEFMDYAEDGTEGTKPSADQAAVVIEGEVSEYRALIKEDKPYIDIDAVQEYIDERFYWDSKDGYVMYTNATDIYTSYVGESDCYLDGAAESLESVISYEEGETCYVSMEFVDKFADVDYKLYKADENKPARLCISYGSGDYITAVAEKNNKLRTDADLMAAIVAEPAEGDKITILEEQGEWYKAQTEDGFIGYVQTKYYEDKKTEKIERENDYDTYTHNTMEEKVKLVWHQVTNYTANDTLMSYTENMDGANVISPTWFTMSDKKGGIQDISSSDYVDSAHNMGLEVWPLVDDFSEDSKGVKYVNSVLASTSKREKFEDNLIHALVRCGADGINIDFEYISLENANNYLQFLREMSIKCKKNGLVMSVDNYIPSDWSGYYDLNQQGRLADYVIVMSYDEHTTSSDSAGPVASLPFVKKAVEDTVALVGDASRVIMGVPFYTRIWQETPEEYAEDGSKIIEDNINGNYALSSEAVSMETARARYEGVGAQPAWNEEAGTNYVYFEENNSIYQIWIEDATSIQKKLDVATENGVGGIGCWKLGLETADIWDVIKAFE